MFINFINFSYVIFWGQMFQYPQIIYYLLTLLTYIPLVDWKSSSNISMTHRDTSFVETNGHSSKWNCRGTAGFLTLN